MPILSRPNRLILLFSLVITLLPACSMRGAFGLPSIAEEGAMLRQAIDATMRAAVFVKKENYVHDVPELGLGDYFATAIARETKGLFGTETIAMSHGEEEEWPLELANSGKDHKQFFQSNGYDLYIEVVVNPDIPLSEDSILMNVIQDRYSTERQKDLRATVKSINTKPGTKPLYRTFSPIYRIWKVLPSGEIQRLVAGGTSDITCTTDFIECANSFGHDFRKVIVARFEASKD